MTLQDGTSTGNHFRTDLLVGMTSTSRSEQRPRVVAVVQARMGSTRLPGKVLADVAGRPMLQWVVTRVGRSSSVDEVVVATTTLAQDDILQGLGDELGVRVVRGDALDVLSRYTLAVGETGADVVVRVTSDCPFIDPDLTTTVVTTLVGSEPPIDYVSNALPPRSYPRGLDVEAVTSSALLEADRLDTDPGTREHVTPYIAESDRFRITAVANEEDLSAVRWTVDTAADLDVVRRIAEYFGGRDTMTWQDLLAAWRTHPAWHELNADVEQKEIRRRMS
jgi:spore coat polysaccharide biosynthesis protein SpsF (cytidylyltransferase family)